MWPVPGFTLSFPTNLRNLRLIKLMNKDKGLAKVISKG